MIKPVNIVTNNVARELLRIAAQNATSKANLFIKINSVKTLLVDEDSNLVEIPENSLQKYTTEKSLRDATVKFEQEYDIEIESIYRGYPFEGMITELELTQSNTLAHFIIKKGSRLTYYDELYDDFLDYIDEQKLRLNIMLELFDADYEDTIKQLVDIIKKIKSIVFKKDIKILVSRGLEAIESVNSKTSMTIEENLHLGAEDSTGKVDYSNRGFLLNCLEGEELFEFIKPQQGKPGRSCTGRIIEVDIVNLDIKPTFTVDDGIEVQESFDNIKYLSKRSGFLVKKGNQYDLSNDIDVEEISFKTTGTINSDLDSEISINVVKNDPLEDAIEEGMHVKVQKLSIKGSIGPNTEIEAREIYIDGQTHQESSIKCVNAYISIHKGKITGRKVEVKTLEGGEIIADTAIIKNAVRGKIRAKTIDIEMLGSHVIMEASEYIQIEKVKGEENKFIIDPLVDSGFDKNKEDNQNYLKKLKEELNQAQLALKTITIKLKKSLEPCEKIKATIIKNRAEEKEVSPVLIKNFKICKIMKARYKSLKEDVEYRENKIRTLQRKLSSHTFSVLNSKIVTNRPLKGFNHIVYKLNNPPVEIELRTNENMNKKIFKLTEDVDGILSIINTN
ncbi:MAG: hypothetical protein ACJAWW_001009 [Sulfurimonas sp.]|jgi:hypothetical protein